MAGDPEGDRDRERHRALLRRNIALIRTVRALRMCLFGIPFMVVYFQSCGVSVQGVLQIKAVSAISNVILEVPSGYCSDHWGRKPTLLVAILFSGLYWLAVGIASSKPMFMACQVLLGVGDSFFSGTDTAVLFESISGLGEEDAALKGEAHTVAINQVTESAASILGGVIAHWVGIRATVWLTCIPYAAALVACAFIHEPELTTASLEAGARRSKLEALRHTYGGLKGDFSRRAVVAPLGVGALNAIASYMSVWLSQPLWERGGIPLKYFGVAWAGLNMNVAISAMFAAPLQSWLGIRGALYLLSAWVVFCYGLLGAIVSPWVLLAGCMLYWVRGSGGPIINTYLNSEIPAERRATVMSLKGLLNNCLFTALSTFVGAVEHKGGLSWACIAAGLSIGGGMAAGLFWGGRGGAAEGGGKLGGHVRGEGGGGGGGGGGGAGGLEMGAVAGEEGGAGAAARPSLEGLHPGAEPRQRPHHAHLPAVGDVDSVAAAAAAAAAGGEEEEFDDVDFEEGAPLLPPAGHAHGV